MSNTSSASDNALYMAKAILPSNYVYMIFGAATVVSNLLLIFVQIRSKREKNNFTYNVIHLAAADMYLGITAVCLGTKRYQTAVNNEFPVRVECLVALYFWYSSVVSGIAQTFCMALDRLLSVLVPTLYYANLNGPKMQLINLSQWLLIFVIPSLGPLAFERPLTVIPSCVVGVVFTSSFAQGYILFIMGYCAVTSVLYAAIIVVVKVRVRLDRKHKNVNVVRVKRPTETKVLVSVGLIVVFYLFTWLCCMFGAQVVTLVCVPTVAQIVLPYLGVIPVINSSLNVPIYLLTNESVREDFAAVLWRGNKVKPASTTSTANTHSKNTTPHTQQIH